MDMHRISLPVILHLLPHSRLLFCTPSFNGIHNLERAETNTESEGEECLPKMANLFWKVGGRVLSPTHWQDMLAVGKCAYLLGQGASEEAGADGMRQGCPSGAEEWPTRSRGTSGGERGAPLAGGALAALQLPSPGLGSATNNVTGRRRAKVATAQAKDLGWAEILPDLSPVTGLEGAVP